MLKNRIISKNELDILFSEELTQLEIRHLGRLIIILGKYLILDTAMLFALYKTFYGEKLKMKYLKQAANLKLVIEYKYNLESDDEKNIYYYALKESSYYLLYRSNIQYLRVPLLSTDQEKSRVLNFNKFAIEQGYEIAYCETDFSYFLLKNHKIVCFYADITTKEAIMSALATKKINTAQYSFKEIIVENVLEFGLMTKAMDPTHINY